MDHSENCGCSHRDSSPTSLLITEGIFCAFPCLQSDNQAFLLTCRFSSTMHVAEPCSWPSQLCPTTMPQISPYTALLRLTWGWGASTLYNCRGTEARRNKQKCFLLFQIFTEGCNVLGFPHSRIRSSKRNFLAINKTWDLPEVIAHTWVPNAFWCVPH